MGVAFITFNHPECVQESIANFKTDILEITKGSPHNKTLNLEEWTLQQAPPVSDIVWEHLRYYDKTLSWIKSIFLSILLFVLCIVVVTPLTLLDKLTPI